MKKTVFSLSLSWFRRQVSLLKSFRFQLNLHEMFWTCSQCMLISGNTNKHTLHCNSHHLCLPQSRLNSRHVLFVKHRVWTEFCLYGKYIVIIIVKTNLIMLLLTDVKAFIFCQFSNLIILPPPGIHRVTLSVLTEPWRRPRLYEYFTFFHSVFCKTLKSSLTV